MLLHEAWEARIYELLHHGLPIHPRPGSSAGPTQELLCRKFAFKDSRRNILDVPERDLNFRFMVAEWLWMMFGHSDVSSISQYNHVIKEFSDDGVWLTGAYGPHINAQRHSVLRKLKEDPATRQAVIEIPRPHRFTKDEPCTLSLQFLRRDGMLHLIATMRSSDIWLGIPYDVFTFTMLQNCMAGELGIKRGWFALNAGSAHIYERNVAAAQAAQRSPTGRSLTTVDLPGFPPSWLDSVLMTRDPRYVPVPNSPWHPFAEVLLSPTRSAARDVLIRHAPTILNVRSTI